MKDIVFISDLHLMPERPEIMDLFVRFSEDIAAGADALYILGDFLEVWWGDDDPATGYQDVFNTLARLATQYHTEIFLMHGNRDFMIGETLAQRCHFKIIPDPHKISYTVNDKTGSNHNKRDILLLHGDTLCTDDIEYQKFRQMVRNPLWQQQALTKTLEQRHQLAQSFREKSKQTTTKKDASIMDANQAETKKVFLENDIDLIIHGHTHRPMIHRKKLNGHDTTRIVLGDWHDAGSYLRINGSSDFKLQTYQ